MSLPGKSVLIDSHCHLNLDQFDEDRDAVLARAQEQGVAVIVNPGIDLDNSRQAIALAEAHPAVYAAVGVHPNSSGSFDDQTLLALEELTQHPKVVAIGEIGLDYYWDKVAPAQQAVAFRAQLELAAQAGLPVIIHNRDASGDVAEVLQSWATSERTQSSPLAARQFWGVLHAFGGDVALARQAYGWNFVLGLGGPITFKNARTLHQLVPNLRPDRLMVETDAPYLAPHPRRGQRNEPAYVALVAERLADLLEVSVQEVADGTTEVACSLFAIRINGYG